MPLRTGHFGLGHFPSGAFPDGHWPLPPVFPVSLDEIKDFLLIDSDDEDFILVPMLMAATSWAEMFQRRFYIKRINIEYFDSFPEIIYPVYSPLAEIDSIKYIDNDGVTQLLDSDNYLIDIECEPGRITPAYGLIWPTTMNVTNAVIVTYSAGYGDASDVPDDIKAAIKMLVQYWYERGLHPSLISQAKKILWKKRIVSI